MIWQGLLLGGIALMMLYFSTNQSDYAQFLNIKKNKMAGAVGGNSVDDALLFYESVGL
jgi:hypothetical protein